MADEASFFGTDPPALLGPPPVVLSPVSSEPQFPHYSSLAAVTWVLPASPACKNTEGDQGPTPGGPAGPHTPAPPRPGKTPLAAAGAGTRASRPLVAPALTTATPVSSSILALPPLGGPSFRKLSRTASKYQGTTEGRGAGRPPHLGPEPGGCPGGLGGLLVRAFCSKAMLQAVLLVPREARAPALPARWARAASLRGGIPRSAHDGPGAGLVGTLLLYPLARQPGHRSSGPAHQAGAGGWAGQGQVTKQKGPWHPLELWPVCWQGNGDCRRSRRVGPRTEAESHPPLHGPSALASRPPSEDDGVLLPRNDACG